jgi:predicted NUDIX family NTP pyrophosphohydrolase
VKKSAGVLMYRFRDGNPQVLLGHMGGPFWARKDEGAWSIPKGEYGEDEEAFQAAAREFQEETGFRPEGGFDELKPARRPKGKHVRIWVVEGDFDTTRLVSNTFELEWPPRSGKTQAFPELDKAAWFTVPVARRKIVKGQVPFLEAFDEWLRNRSS